ncbi:MAG: AAA family ATPase [Desulfovibrionaceae bacterium]|nr:AAA family ATPase [Desulfovibrionaceae bacterium]
MSVKPLPSEKLCPLLPTERVPWDTSDAIPRNARRTPPQPRALKAMELALNINKAGYNIYLSGPENMGRIYLLREFLEPRAKRLPTPPDLVYVNRFDDQDRPNLLSVPAGQGKRLRDAMAAALADIRKELPSRLEHASNVKRRGAIQKKFQDTRTALLQDMDKIAGGKGFNLDVDDQGGLTLYPLVEGKRLSEEEFEHLDDKLRQRLKRKGNALIQAMSGLVRKLSDAERIFHSDERDLDREIIDAVLEDILKPVQERLLKACPDNPPLERYFQELRDDILNNPDLFLPKDGLPVASAANSQGTGTQPHPAASTPNEDPYRYDINLFVDNSALHGAPIVVDDHPTSANLLGCIERESEMGALVTDFTLIKAGSLHRANGGFLILRVEDILQHPSAWEGLLRALRANSARLDENIDAPDGAVRTKGIEPAPVPLDLKVILIGSEDLYETLLAHDLRFSKLFKIKAQLTDAVDRTAQNVRDWIARLAKIIDGNALLPFSREAMAGLVDYSSLLCEDQKKLSLRYPIIRDAMIEAEALARAEKGGVVSRAHLDEALSDRLYRANLVEELYMEEYDRDMLKVHVTGEAVGQVNGLSVTMYGDFEFGLPHLISCTVGVGHGGIIDLEREAELGGPIHTKAMLILKSYLVRCFAYNKPLVLTGSLCFEQNYGGIEGDSASGAELAALLSAISETPLNLSLAFTGAVSQTGNIMAVGGVSRKIEGFFSVCARRGLTSKQGVIIPADNVDHLMLPPRIREAVGAGKFAIYPVRHITEAMELLTGIPAGRPLKNGGFSKGSLYDRVDQRLQELGRLAEHAYAAPPRRRNK